MSVAGESKAVIHHLLPRRTQFVRKQPVSGGKKKGRFEGQSIMDGGSTDEQVIASNVDTLFIVAGLDQNYNIHRIERYLTQAYTSGARPVILLNKADLCRDAAARVLEVEQVAGGLPVYAVSAIRSSGLDCIGSYLGRGQTAEMKGDEISPGDQISLKNLSRLFLEGRLTGERVWNGRTAGNEKDRNQ